jgi:hypothetical protein
MDFHGNVRETAKEQFSAVQSKIFTNVIASEGPQKPRSGEIG